MGLSEHPDTSRDLADMYKGTLEGLRVCVKKVRIYSDSDPEKAKVWYPSFLFTFPLSEVPCR